MRKLLISKKEALLIFLGVTVICCVITWFLMPQEMVTGGVAGLGIIVESLSESVLGFKVPISVTTILLNLPLFMISIRQRGFEFAKKSLYAVLLTSFTLWYMAFVPNPVPIGDDMLLTAVFGGVGLGAGVGLVLKASATTGGSDMLASIIKFKYANFPIAQLMLFIDGLIILGGFFMFGVVKAMYGIITITIASRMISRVLEGGHGAKAAFIMSSEYEAIAQAIMEKIPRGSTGLKARGMYSGDEKEMLFVVVSQKEISRLREIIYEIDANAFVTIADVKEVLGEGFIKEYNPLTL